MPNLADIQNEINNYKSNGQDIIRRRYLKNLHRYTKNDTIIYSSSYAIGRGVAATVSTEDMQGFMTALNGLKGGKLDLILHSPGGSLEAAEQIVNYLRNKYAYIRVIVPQNAMSAATMIACAANEIVMGKQSAIGPIDPQITFPTQNGLFTAPAQALLDDFEKAKADVSANVNLAPLWVSKIKDYPPGILKVCENTLELSKEKVALWLGRYMFNGDSDAQSKAKAIAKWLADARQHKAHGHPINFDEAQEHGLKVVRLEDDQKLQDRVLTVFHATAATFGVTQCVKIIENHMGKGRYTIQNM